MPDAEARANLRTFLYLLMRDHVPTGAVVDVIVNVEKYDNTGSVFTAVKMADYADELALRLLRKKSGDE